MKRLQNDEAGAPPHLRPLPSLGARRTAYVFLALALLVGVSYANALRNGFAYDDMFIISQNGLITRLDTLPKLLTSDYWATRFDPFGDRPLPQSSGLYRPLIFLSYALNYAVNGLNPLGFHLVNVLLHLVVTWLVYLLALQLRISSSGAIVAAVLFAIHPIHTEAVTNVVGRAELMMSVGVLASLWLAAIGRHGWSLFAFGLSLFCKEQAVMVPAIVLLYDLCFRPRTSNVEPALSGQHSAVSGQHLFRTSNFALRTSHVVRRYGPYLPVLVGYFVVRWAVLGGLPLPPTPMIDNPLSALDGFARVYNAFKVDGLYLQLFVWPSGLSADYSFDAIPAARSMFEPAVLLAILAWGSLVAGAAWAFMCGNGRVAFSLGFAILVFLPVSNLLVLIGTIMGERLFYLPSAGLCLLAGIGYERLTRQNVRRTTFDVQISELRDPPLSKPEPRTSSLEPRTFRTSNFARRTLLNVFVVLVCIALIGRTVIRNQDWFSDETLFQSALRVVPRSAKVYATLGTLALPEKKWDEAHQFFSTALQIYPTYSLTDGHLLEKIGAGLLGKGDVDQAVDTLERAVALERDSRLAQYNLGLAYAKTGRHEDAERAYRRALVLEPKDPETYIGLSYVLTKLERFSEAEEMALEAIRLRPDSAEAHYNRGRALEGSGRVAEARLEYRRVVEITPTAEKVKERLIRLGTK